MKKNWIFIVCILNVNIACSQNKEIRFFKFQVENKEYIDEWEYEGMQYEYYVIKEYLKDDIFIQRNVFNLESKVFISIDTFKLKDKCWHYLYHGDYYPYICKASFEKNQVIRKKLSSNTYYEFYPKQKYQGESLLEYEKKIVTPISVERVGSIFFDLEKGIVKQEIDGTILLLKKENNEDMLEKLRALL
jgi:hypothetical protein